MFIVFIIIAISSFREAQRADKVNEARPTNQAGGKRKISQKGNQKVIFFRNEKNKANQINKANQNNKGNQNNSQPDTEEEHKEQYKITTTDSNKKPAQRKPKV